MAQLQLAEDSAELSLNVGDTGRNTATLERRRKGPVRPRPASTVVRGNRRCIPQLGTTAAYRISKRVLDICGALCGLVVFGPLMAVCAAMIKLHDGGPVLFGQVRVGERGRHFRIFKFRSMVVNADELKAELLERNHHDDSRTFKILHDPRITAVGRAMRRLSLDELPQLWNVLVGDMSLVGPRPPVPEEVALYSCQDMVRLAVKPGLTCIWQVSGRSNLDFPQQLALDREYIRRRSLWLDLKLIALTIPAVLRADGAA